MNKIVMFGTFFALLSLGIVASYIFYSRSVEARSTSADVLPSPRALMAGDFLYMSTSSAHHYAPLGLAFSDIPERADYYASPGPGDRNLENPFRRPLIALGEENGSFSRYQMENGEKVWIPGDDVIVDISVPHPQLDQPLSAISLWKSLEADDANIKAQGMRLLRSLSPSGLSLFFNSWLDAHEYVYLRDVAERHDKFFKLFTHHLRDKGVEGLLISCNNPDKNVRSRARIICAALGEGCKEQFLQKYGKEGVSQVVRDSEVNDEEHAADDFCSALGKICVDQMAKGLESSR